MQPEEVDPVPDMLQPALQTMTSAGETDHRMILSYLWKSKIFTGKLGFKSHIPHSGLPFSKLYLLNRGSLITNYFVP